MPTLFVVGGGLFGSQAAAFARHKGLEAVVFDAHLSGAASPAAAGLFKAEWVGKKLREQFPYALPVLEQLYSIQSIPLKRDDGSRETFLFVPPRLILEPSPIREGVTAVGDGWLEAGGRRYEGWVYVAAGVWCGQLIEGLDVCGKAGSSFLFQGEREGQIRPLAYGRQALAFVRDPGTTYFSDGTAEREHTAEHDRQTLTQAAALGLTEPPLQRFWGQRPYTPGGPVFRKIGARTWVATGGRKMGTILGAAFARRLVEEELH